MEDLDENISLEDLDMMVETLQEPHERQEPQEHIQEDEPQESTELQDSLDNSEISVEDIEQVEVDVEQEEVEERTL